MTAARRRFKSSAGHEMVIALLQQRGHMSTPDYVIGLFCFFLGYGLFGWMTGVGVSYFAPDFGLPSDTRLAVVFLAGVLWPITLIVAAACRLWQVARSARALCRHLFSRGGVKHSGRG